MAGRPPFKPTPAQTKQVQAMASYGIPQGDIAKVIGIDEKTLRKHFRNELDTGETKANALVAQNLFRKATGEGRESVTAAIFWLKTRARWSEKVELEHSGPNGGPIEQLLTKRVIYDPKQ